MLGVYRNMALGLGITALVALLIASTPAVYQPIFGTPLKWVAILAPLAFVLFFSFRMERMTTAQARTAFYAFAAVMGVSMASIFLVFAGTSIALAFFSAAAVFAAISLWGYTTNVDLSRGSTLGSFVVRGVLALALGAVAFLFPVSALFALTMVFAAYAGADGLLSTVAGVRGAARREERWWALILRGIIGIAVAE